MWTIEKRPRNRFQLASARPSLARRGHVLWGEDAQIPVAWFADNGSDRALGEVNGTLVRLQPYEKRGPIE